MPIVVLIPGGANTVAPIPLSLDGISQTNNVVGSTFALPTFTTSNPNDIILVAIVTNGGPVTSITGGGLTWAREPGLTPPHNKLELWYAVANATFSAAITVNTTASAFATALIWAVTGGKISSPFDPSSPQSDATSNTVSITTTAANTFAFGISDTGAAAPINGFTNINATAAGNFLTVNYKIVSAPLVSVAFDSGSTSQESIGAAIQLGP